MFNQEFSWQNIFKQDCQYLFLYKQEPSKITTFFIIPSKNQTRQQLLEKAQSRSRREFFVISQFQILSITMSPTSPALRQSLFPNVPPFINYLPLPDEKPSCGSGGPAQVTPPVDLHVSNQI